MDKEKYMKRCIQLASYGKLHAAPNPLVGAVIVHKGIIIGEGFHIQSGKAHAEVNAINSVKDQSLLPESTIFVSLEPCSHTGKTPPCVDLIINKKIPHVVIGCQDPFSKVAGRGIAKLKEQGIKVEIGILENECKELIHRFYIFQEEKRPYILLKWAESADGYIDQIRSSGTPTLLSSPLSSILTHKRRAEVESILVGRRTALLDNPSLTTRHWYQKNPVRLIIDRYLSLPNTLHIFDGSTPTFIFTEVDKKSNFKNRTYIQLDFNADILTQILNWMYFQNIQSVLVEGGAQLHQSFIDANLWDEIHIEESPQSILKGVSAAQIPTHTKYQRVKKMGRYYRIYKKKEWV